MRSLLPPLPPGKENRETVSPLVSLLSQESPPEEQKQSHQTSLAVAEVKEIQQSEEEAIVPVKYHREEQLLYEHLLHCVKHESPEQVIERFRKLFG